MSPIDLLGEKPLALRVDEETASNLAGFDAGAAYTRHLHEQVGEFDTCELGQLVEAVRNTVNPQAQSHATTTFDYVDLREVDEVFGQILDFKRSLGRQIGSSKVRFQTGDILFARIMPSLANKKVAFVDRDVTNGVASTEFFVLRVNRDADINPYFLFRALRADAFTRQAEANVTGATGRQRLSVDTLLSLQVVLPPRELQDQIGRVVEEEFQTRARAAELSQQADDEAFPVLGETTRRTDA